MKRWKGVAMAAVMVFLVSGPLRAQGNDQVKPVLPTKWSQLVDVDNGHDVYSFWPAGADFPAIVVADDWKCLNGLPVTDFHWWGSYIEGTPRSPSHEGAGVSSFELSIHSDVPADGAIPSHPGELLWRRDFLVGPAVQEIYYSPGEDHDIYQYTLLLSRSEDYFPQVENTIYWLNIIGRCSPDTVWGWHTAVRPGPLDAAVMIYDYDPFEGTYSRWLSLYDDQCNVQMAFELTTIPEPATIGLVGTAALMLAGLIYRRRMR